MHAKGLTYANTTSDLKSEFVLTMMHWGVPEFGALGKCRVLYGSDKSAGFMVVGRGRLAWWS